MTTATIPGYQTGTWSIDPVHSNVTFVARHLMVSKVRGEFSEFSGEITTAENLADSTVTVTVDMASFSTRNEQRDAHVRSADFFEVEKYPTMTFTSTGIRPDGEDFAVTGDLTIKGVPRSVEFTVEFNGISHDVNFGTRAGFSARTTINRQDFNVSFARAIEGGGAVVGDKIQIELDIEAVLQS